MKNNILAGKNIVVAVTGGIAAYKACEIVSLLKKQGANVKVIMTSNATQFVSPLTFQTLSQNTVITDMFVRPEHWEVEHISVAKSADLFLIAPCTANVIGKVAAGIADDFLTTTIMACKAPIIFAPAMNTAMYNNPVFQHNCSILQGYGYHFINPIEGRLACGDIGEGKLPEPIDIVNFISNFFKKKKDFLGKKILITAGATSEPIDSVRFITNRSSGKMGYGLAKAAVERGAQVTVIHGEVKVNFADLMVSHTYTSDTRSMFEAVKNIYDQYDYIIMAAAPSDYRPINFSSKKIKDAEFSLHLIKNPDIAAFLGEHKENQKLIIFCAETDNLKENARQKLTKKHANMIVANDITQEGAGFDSDTNIVTIMTDQYSEDIPKTDKYNLAHIILDRILKL